jgi:hypothetical protein
MKSEQKLVILTIVKDGLPWIAEHYPTYRSLAIPWEWHVVEGTASARHCTKWCRDLRPGLSEDGTTEYLDSIAFDPRVFLYRSEIWNGKVAMVNAPLYRLDRPCVLLQADADELWERAMLERLHSLVIKNQYNTYYHYCRYYLGPDIIITSTNTFGNRTESEWCRAWKYTPGQRFTSHEPPRLDIPHPIIAPHKHTAKHQLVFDHYAYATERQVRFKVEYYGSPNNKLGHLYSDAVEGWHRLQQNQVWPVKVRDFLRFVRDDATATRTDPWKPKPYTSRRWNQTFA